MPSIRIIAGKFGGRKIEAPSSDNKRTHPMGERIRNAIFNSLGARLDGAYVLDAFAGTGAIGLEALSRGAQRVMFIEKDKVAQNILAANQHVLAVESQTKLIKTTVSNWAETYNGEHFDLIFADPPYFDTQVGSIARLMPLLAESGMLIVSWPEKEAAPEFTGLRLDDERIYAGAKILFYEKE